MSVVFEIVLFFFTKKNVREIDAAVKRNLLNKQLKLIQYRTGVVLDKGLCSLPEYFCTINIFQLFEDSRFRGFTVFKVTATVSGVNV